MTTHSARLLVALDAAEETLAMLEGFTRLAAGLQRELVGLLLEDPALASAAALPFTRLMSQRGPGESALDPATTQRAMRVFARRVQEQLAALCGRHKVPWSFRVMRGGLAEAGLAEGDVLVLGPHGRALGAGAPAAACPMVLMRASGRAVVVLHEGSPETIRLGREIAERERLALRVLVLAGEPPGADLVGPAAMVDALAGVADEALRQRIAAAVPRAVVLDACSATLRWPSAAAALTGARREKAGHG